MKIIGFTGIVGSGKSTSAARLAGYYLPEEVREINFADPLKRACWGIFGGEHRNYYGTQADKAEETPFWREALGPNYATYRKIMQTFGTEVMRNHVDKEIWVKCMDNAIKKARADGKDLVVITDVRFDNEGKYLKGIGASIIECINLSLPVSDTPDTHQSEQGILPDYIDMQLASKNLDELHAGIEHIVHAYG